MEHVDGETLEARIQRGPVPWPESLEHLRQIADSLDKAHRRGIVHRDLKPANVMLTRAGVKLLDFGLAAWTVPNDRAAVTGPALDGAGRLTGEGRIMGTVQYLSPEQLQGKQPDARSDIFALGVLAYEMITGRPAFDGESPAALIGAILKDEPQSITELAPDVPGAITRTIARCLSKDPDDRWQTTNDLSFQLRSTIATPDRTGLIDARPLSRWRERAVWIAAVVTSLAAAAFIWTRIPASGVSRSDGRPIRFSLVPPEGEAFASGFDTPFAVSPDGRLITFVSTTPGGTRQLWIRSLEDEQQHPVPGTDGARDPFWSPDSQWIGFFAANTLKKVRISSGLTQVIARDVSRIGGASWNTDGTILFASNLGGLSRVDAAGGAVAPATKAVVGSHFWPHFLGDGRHFHLRGSSHSEPRDRITG
jgi:serine/threonine protein kinase